MARLSFGNWSSGTGEGVSGTGAGTGLQSTVTRNSAPYAFICPGAAGGARTISSFPNLGGGVRFARFWLRVDALPTAQMPILRTVSGAGFRLTVSINTDGTIASGSVANSAAAIVPGTWFCLEVSVNATTQWVVRLNGTAIAAAQQYGGSGWNGFSVGNITSVAGTVDLYIADYAVNDDTGAADTSYPGYNPTEKTKLLLPVSDVAVGTNWKTSASATIPAGTAWSLVDDVPAVTVGNSLRNAVSATGVAADRIDLQLDAVPPQIGVSHRQMFALVADNSNTVNVTFNLGPVGGTAVGVTSAGQNSLTPVRDNTDASGSASTKQVRVEKTQAATTVGLISQVGEYIEYVPAPTQTLVLPVLSITPDLYAPTVTDYEIQDPGEIDDPVIGSVYISGETVRSVTEVRLYVVHSRTDHLLVTLKPPDNSPEVTLFDHRGFMGVNIGASAGSPLILRDDAASSLGSFVAGTGQTLRPEQPLSTFKNEAGGTWTITVTDTSTSTTVTLPYARIDTTGPKGQKKVLKPKLLSITPTLFAPTVTGGIVTLVLPVLSVTPTLFAPEVSLISAPPQSLTVPVLSVTPQLFAPSLSVGTVALQTPLLSVTPELFPPSLDPLAVQLVVPLLSVVPEFFGPTLTVGTVTLHLPLLSITPQLFPMAVNPREVTVSLPLLELTPEVFAPAIHMRLVLPVLVVTPELFEPQIIPGLVVLSLPLLEITPQVIAPRLLRRVFRSQVGHQKTTVMAGQKAGTGPGYQKTSTWSGETTESEPGHQVYSNPGHIEVI